MNNSVIFQLATGDNLPHTNLRGIEKLMKASKTQPAVVSQKGRPVIGCTKLQVRSDIACIEME